MVNHKTYDIIENNKTYKVLEYVSDNDKDEDFVFKFVNRHKYCKVISKETHIFLPKGINYHPYYFPGIPLSTTYYFEDGVLIEEIMETQKDYETKMLKKERKEKIKSLFS